MKNSIAIRQQFRLSQNDLAIYLQITRSQLAMYENCKRDLPTHAIVKLAEIELFLLNHNLQEQNQTLPHEAEQIQKAVAIFEKHQKKLIFQQLLLQKKLNKLQENYKHNKQLLKFLIEKESKNTHSNTLEKSWIAMMKTIALRKIKKNGLQHQAKIQLQMKMNLLYDKSDFINDLTISIVN